MNDSKRFQIRLALEDAGCAVAGYIGAGFQVQFKRGFFGQVWKTAKANGLELREGSLFYFPLGSDNPPPEFRHWKEPYTPKNGFPNPGFWLCATFETKNGELLC